MALPIQLTEQQYRERIQRAAAMAHSGDAMGALQELHGLLIQTGRTEQAKQIVDKAKGALQPSELSSATLNVIEMLSGLQLQSQSCTSETAQVGGASHESSSTSSLNTSLPILQETGRESIAAASVKDGSSFQCPRCKGIFSQARIQTHMELWCEGQL